LKRIFLLSILALFGAAFISLAAEGQVLRPRKGATPEEEQSSYKWEAYAGFGYTSLNQLNQSRSGLMGVEASITRDFGKYFGLTADGAFYKYAVSNGNPGTPSVDMVLFGPELHADLFGRTSGFVHALLGGEHLGGENVTPNLSFAGGFGVGLEYSLKKRLAVRVGGDYIGQAFTLSGYSKTNGYSPHRTWDARPSIGVAYKF